MRERREESLLSIPKTQPPTSLLNPIARDTKSDDQSDSTLGITLRHSSAVNADRSLMPICISAGSPSVCRRLPWTRSTCGHWTRQPRDFWNPVHGG